MTYVYVLVSGKNDLYYEQALMSTYSLRNLMPAANDRHESCSAEE